MTLAVCVRCGESKVGAFTPCARCGLDPAAHGTDRELQAKSLFLTDRFLPGGELEALGRKLRAGEPVAWDAARLAELVEELKTQKLPIVSKASPGCSVIGWAMLGAVVVLVAGLVWFWKSRGG
jgi:pantothenate kinase